MTEPLVDAKLRMVSLVQSRDKARVRRFWAAQKLGSAEREYNAYWKLARAAECDYEIAKVDAGILPEGRRRSLLETRRAIEAHNSGPPLMIGGCEKEGGV